MLNLYERNKLDAEEKYKGKLVRMQGSVKHIDDDYIEIIPNPSDQFQQSGARCNVLASERSKISGLVNAGHVEIELGGRSNAREIRGSRIAVKSRQSFLPWVRTGNHLNVELIEGDDISLEATSAQIIRGRRVKVGDRCRIDTVEYGESLEISSKAAIQNQKKT